MAENRENALTLNERNQVWDAIINGRERDDRDPETVIQEKFKGDTSAYLRRMALWHDVSLDS